MRSARLYCRALFRTVIAFRWPVYNTGLSSLTVEEWSGLLCDSTGQHAVGRCQGRAGCLCGPVLTLYLPECGAPAAGVWLEHIILLIVHTGALGEELPGKQEREKVNQMHPPRALLPSLNASDLV